MADWYRPSGADRPALRPADLRVVRVAEAPAALRLAGRDHEPGLGFLSTHFGFLPHDPTLALLSSFGIVSLFLWAGLEIHLQDLLPAWRPLLRHLVVFAALVAATAYGCARLFEMEARPAAILALALLTPSAGFILDSMGAFGLSRLEIRRVRATVIVTELFALTALFALTQSSSVGRFSLSVLALAALVLFIPQALKLFASHIAPHAPRTEFAFLLMLAVVCAFATRKLGVYYLVGAFLVGLSARRFRDQLPALSSDRLLQTVEEFAIVFGPFYFYFAGGSLQLADFDLRSIGLGVLLTLVLLPVRSLQIALLQSRGSGFTWAERRRVGTSLLPTLVFSIVLLGILRERFALGSPLLGGVIVYTLLNTLVPGFLLRKRPAAVEDVRAAAAP